MTDEISETATPENNPAAYKARDHFFAEFADYIRTTKEGDRAQVMAGIFAAASELYILGFEDLDGGGDCLHSAIDSHIEQAKAMRAAEMN